jgi:hypothetical protein
MVFHLQKKEKKKSKKKKTKNLQKKEKENWVFKSEDGLAFSFFSWLRQGLLEPPPPVRQLEHPGKEGFPGEAVEACLQSPAKQYKVFHPC